MDIVTLSPLGFPGYRISTDGTVLSNIGNKGMKGGHKDTWSPLKHGLDSYGYPMVILTDPDRKRKAFLVHKLVALMFIPNPSGKNQVNHIDGNKNNNNVSNLEWATPSENTVHAYRMGLASAARGERSGRSKLKESQVLEIIELLGNSVSKSEIAKKYGISVSQIQSIASGRSWKHLGRCA